MRDVELLELLARQEARYRTTLTDLERDVYLDDLAHLDALTLRAAFNRCAQSSPKYFPTVHELLKAVDDMDLAAGRRLDGDAAWAEFEARVLSRYSFGVTKVFDWPDDDTKDIVRNHLGLSLAVHNLATLDSAFERDKYRKLFVRLYNERRQTAQAVERAELAIDGPGNVRRLGAGD